MSSKRKPYVKAKSNNDAELVVKKIGRNPLKRTGKNKYVGGEGGI